MGITLCGVSLVDSLGMSVVSTHSNQKIILKTQKLFLLPEENSDVGLKNIMQNNLLIFQNPNTYFKLKK